MNKVITANGLIASPALCRSVSMQLHLRIDLFASGVLQCLISTRDSSGQ
jgi:hypothetical protein